jgi:hypothetical protein
MRGLDKRLTDVEARLLPKQETFLGSFEMHYTEAWPDCKDESEYDLLPCDEHGPRCRKTVTPLRQPGLRTIVVQGPWVALG